MNLKTFYQKLKNTEESIPEPFVVLISNATADGGKPGVYTEVSRRVAARLILDGSARLATEEETLAYRKQIEEARHAAQQVAAASKIQVMLVSDPSGNLQAKQGPGSSQN
jgi:hypothetical protein